MRSLPMRKSVPARQEQSRNGSVQGWENSESRALPPDARRPDSCVSRASAPWLLFVVLVVLAVATDQLLPVAIFLMEENRERNPRSSSRSSPR